MTGDLTNDPVVVAAIDQLSSPQSTAEPDLAAFFLGPKAENQDLFADLVQEAVQAASFYRRDFHPEDPAAITGMIRNRPGYLESVDRLRARYSELLAYLGAYTTPYYSMRYLGHMLWDTTLPSMLGYFATMLHNPNNVTVQASTVTTFLELQVGWELCAMAGFRFGDNAPWGHITADGSIANIEAAWSARELKHLPLAVKAALTKQGGEYAPLADKVKVRSGDDEVILTKLDPWRLLNIRMEDALGLPAQLAELSGGKTPAVWKSLDEFSLNAIGWRDFYANLVGDGVGAPVLIGPSSMHYSWPKAMAVVGAGASQVWPVYVDADARIDLDLLEQKLERAVELRQPVMLAVAVMGTTEEGAVDPLRDVLDLRGKFRDKGLEFNVHADAAWGGYFCAAIRRDFELPRIIDGSCTPTAVGADEPGTYLSRYTVRQLEAIADADSVTIDPHKMGYIPYPAGALCYQDGRMPNLVTFGASVIGSDVTDISIGQHGLEGSKPGASPAAVWLSHAVLPPSVSGYGKLIRHVMYNTKLLYLRMRHLTGDHFRTTVLAREPAAEPDAIAALATKAAAVEGGIRFAESITNEQEDVLREVGPDMNMVDYVFNFKWADGTWNTDLDALNEFNVAVYDKFHVKEGKVEEGRVVAFGERGDDYPLIISQTELAVADYGETLLDDFLRRIEIAMPSGDVAIKVNRSVVMDPWDLEMAHPDGGSYLDMLMTVLATTVDELAEERGKS
ncbi:MAG: pyridoxal-dependent decarboxylase [Actinomycetota bacterium]|nr:pyridoxal-dependent decarboxylase [Actinomycetota bacterium]